MNQNDSIVHRDQKKRYLWWVKSVDTNTTEIDDSRLKKLDDRRTAASKGKPARTRKKASQEEITGHVVKGIKENIPGRSLPDLALHYAANTYMHYSIGSLGDPRVNYRAIGIKPCSTRRPILWRPKYQAWATYW